MNQFKLGDRVRVINSLDDCYHKVGNVVQVGNENYVVEIGFKRHSFNQDELEAFQTVEAVVDLKTAVEEAIEVLTCEKESDSLYDYYRDTDKVEGHLFTIGMALHALLEDKELLAGLKAKVTMHDIEKDKFFNPTVELVR